jgi:putative membrane protein insertion efficiency factor
MLAKTARTVVKFFIELYRNCLSPFKLQCCRFYPSCSEYAYLAVEKHGIMKGLLKSAWRVLRCNPFSPGGYDPV